MIGNEGLWACKNGVESGTLKTSVQAADGIGERKSPGRDGRSFNLEARWRKRDARVARVQVPQSSLVRGLDADSVTCIGKILLGLLR